MAKDFRAGVEDLSFNRGDAFSFQFTFFTDAKKTNPLPLTGSTLLLTVNTSPDGSQIDMFQLSPTNVLDATGVAIFQPTVTNMDLEPGIYYYDVQRTIGSEVRTLVRGAFIIDTDVTN